MGCRGEKDNLENKMERKDKKGKRKRVKERIGKERRN
jgi:hypothetical protein